MGQLRFIAGLLAVPLLLADTFWTNADVRTIA